MQAFLSARAVGVLTAVVVCGALAILLLDVGSGDGDRQRAGTSQTVDTDRARRGADGKSRATETGGRAEPRHSTRNRRAIEDRRATADRRREADRSAPDSAERAPRATVVALYDALGGAAGRGRLDAARLCGLMTERARRAMTTYLAAQTQLRDRWSCEAAARRLIERAKRFKGLKRALQVDVIGVNVDGNRATASVRFGKRQPISTLPLVKEDGRWKLGRPPGGRPDRP